MTFWWAARFTTSPQSQETSQMFILLYFRQYSDSESKLACSVILGEERKATWSLFDFFFFFTSSYFKPMKDNGVRGFPSIFGLLRRNKTQSIMSIEQECLQLHSAVHRCDAWCKSEMKSTCYLKAESRFLMCCTDCCWTLRGGITFPQKSKILLRLEMRFMLKYWLQKHLIGCFFFQINSWLEMLEKKMDWRWTVPLFLLGIIAEVRHSSVFPPYTVY